VLRVLTGESPISQTASGGWLFPVTCLRDAAMKGIIPGMPTDKLMNGEDFAPP